MAEQPARKRGRLSTRTQDWETTHKRIRLLNITFEKWRALSNTNKLHKLDVCLLCNLNIFQVCHNTAMSTRYMGLLTTVY